jgi:hypothetical protein
VNIQEATKLALEKDLYIVRENDEMGKYVKIKPTNTSDCCILTPTPYWEEKEERKIAQGKRWHPEALDLIADDWIVVDEHDQPQKSEIRGITIDLSNHDIQPKGTKKNWLKTLLKNLVHL